MHGYNATAGYSYGFYLEATPSWLHWAALNQEHETLKSGFRYLDAGCGQGYALIMSAACHPDSEFIGIDFSPLHIAHARKLAEKAGVRNVQFIEGDFKSILCNTSDLGQFDYVVCHGISSWISADVRQTPMMMVIPLRPAILDVLLAFNFAISILLVISAFLVESPLAFSTFPAMLLMTTLFRLALTISTTRQILLEADAGSIVQTFGEFVVGGNFAVGLVIFLIISVVNFLVITKGSERIAEVAARFSLDGMPGKQMSIDSDLRAGLITQAIAKKRRSDLEKESQLFGAMDGAIKFVKNDAIAGLVITVVNLLGGLAVGMLQKDMSFGDAGRLYVILSVGDGLVAIIPSLLISIAAGLVITRVTKGEVDGANAAQDIVRELGANGNSFISRSFKFHGK